MPFSFMDKLDYFSKDNFSILSHGVAFLCPFLRAAENRSYSDKTSPRFSCARSADK